MKPLPRMTNWRYPDEEPRIGPWDLVGILALAVVSWLGLAAFVAAGWAALEMVAEALCR